MTRSGDLWVLGRHRLLCGDARSQDQVARLTEGAKVDLIFTDPPYNVPIDGHVSGLGAIRHREFAFGSGEMTQAEFTAFLTATLANAASAAKDGAIAFVCMDWRHMRQLEQTQHMRDILLLQDELDERLLAPAQSGTPGGALPMAVALDQTIPERYRLSDVKIGLRACRHQAMTKRALLKALYGAWKTLGVPVKRGWIFPSRERVAEILAFGIDLVAAVRDGRVSAQVTRRGRPDAETERYLQDWAHRIERAP